MDRGFPSGTIKMFENCGDGRTTPNTLKTNELYALNK